MFLKTISNAELLSRLKKLVHQEREVLTDILQHLLEVEDRRLHLEEGYGSIFEYAVQVLKYSEAQAYRRISAMRLLREIPEVKESIEMGDLNLTHVVQAKKYFKTEADHSNPLSKEQKLELLHSLENKTTRQTEKFFAELNPNPVPADRERAIGKDLTEIRFIASDALLEKLKRFKELDSHVLPDANYAELFERLVDLALKVKEKPLVAKEKSLVSKETVKKTTKVFVAPKKWVQKDSNKNIDLDINRAKNSGEDKIDTETEDCKTTDYRTTDYKASRSRTIPIFVKRIVMARDQAACSFVNPLTGKRCGSKYKLQYEHRVPFGKGGSHDAENITIFCQSHNLFMAEKEFGREKINKFRERFH